MFNLEQDADLELIREGSMLDALEAAKNIIRYEFPADNQLLDSLREIALNKNQKNWTRVMAVYTLGFVDHARVSVSDIRRILEDTAEPPIVRDYCAEALGHMLDVLDAESTDLLVRIANTDASPEVRQSAAWALKGYEEDDLERSECAPEDAPQSEAGEGSAPPIHNDGDHDSQPE